MDAINLQENNSKKNCSSQRLGVVRARADSALIVLPPAAESTTMAIENGGTKKKRSRRGGGKARAAAAGATGASAQPLAEKMESSGSDDESTAQYSRGTHFLFFGQSAPFVIGKVL